MRYKHICPRCQCLWGEGLPSGARLCRDCERNQADIEDALYEQVVKELHKMLLLYAEEAADDIAEWGAYASEYFQDKWGLADTEARWRGRADFWREQVKSSKEKSA